MPIILYEVMSDNSNTEKAGAQTLHIISHICQTFPMLPLKQNPLLLGRTLLVTDYKATIKSL
jgi:hypothetical protein